MMSKLIPFYIKSFIESSMTLILLVVYLYMLMIAIVHEDIFLFKVSYTISYQMFSKSVSIAASTSCLFEHF